MAIKKGAVDQTLLYRQALSTAEKRMLQGLPASRTVQTREQPEGDRAQISGNVQAARQLLRQAEEKTPEQSAASRADPVRLKDYTWWNWMGDNDMTTMTDEDKAKWQTAMAGWKRGDYSAYNDGFQKKGNWSSYVDANGEVSGMLRYVGDGIGGYVPVNGGQLLQSGYAGDMSQYAFYGPNGEVYTADSNGRLTRTGTWTRQEPYSALKESVPYKMLKGTATEEEREAWIEGLSPYEPERTDPGERQRTVPGRTAPAQPAEDRQSGRRTASSEKPAEEPAPVPARPGTEGRSDGGIDWQKYIDAYDYGDAPEWDGTEYEQKRDAALEAAGQPREPSEYQRLRDEALRGAGEPWQGSEYRQKRDEALKRAEDMRWSYDRNSDPVWQALEKQYRREGQRSAQDALGQYAAMTGGVPSSYAVTAASQAGDYYAAQLSDRLPELYRNAYERYLEEYQRQLDASDRYAQFDDTEYGRWADQQDRNLQQADRYDDYDRTEYSRYLDERQKQLASADRYQSYGAEEYDRYRDRLSQWNEDRAFRYGLNRDAVEDARYADETAYDRAWNEEDRAYSRNYQARRDAVSDRRYDREWAQELREYADAQGWKQAEWEQYLREYGDQLSERERQWAYQMARDAVSDRQYADKLTYQREAEEYDRAWNEDEREYERSRDSTQWDRAIREYEDEREQRAFDNAYKMLQTFKAVVTQDMADALGVPMGTTLEQYRAAAGYAGGSGRSSAASKTGAADSASGSRYDESGHRAGTWQDADGETYVGYHPDGQWKSQGYDAAWSSVKSMADAGRSEKSVLARIRSLAEQNRITEYEAEMMLVDLGYRRGSAGTGRNSVGPNSVQMVQ